MWGEANIEVVKSWPNWSTFSDRLWHLSLTEIQTTVVYILIVNSDSIIYQIMFPLCCIKTTSLVR